MFQSTERSNTYIFTYVFSETINKKDWKLGLGLGQAPCTYMWRRKSESDIGIII